MGEVPRPGKGGSVSRSPSSPLRPAPGRRSRSRRVPIAEAGGRRRGAHPERDGSRESRGGSRRRSPTGSGAIWIGSGIGLAKRRYGARRGCAGAGGRPSAPRPSPFPCRWRSASSERAGAAGAQEHGRRKPRRSDRLSESTTRRGLRAPELVFARGAPGPEAALSALRSRPCSVAFRRFVWIGGAWRRRHGRANPIRPSSLGRAARPTRAWAHERWSTLGEAPARAGPVGAAEAANLEVAPHPPTRKRRIGRAARVAAARMGNGVRPLRALRPFA